MARAHYIVRVGNEGIARTISPSAPNHWHYLSPQYLWGFPRGMKNVNVRAAFEADIENPRVTTYIWFLCNGHGGLGHFVDMGIGRRHLGQGPVENGALPIPEDMMARLQDGFDHWFTWEPLNPNAAFRDQVRQLPIPQPAYIPTLRRVTADHQSFPRFQDLIDSEEQQAAAITPALPAAVSALPAAVPTVSAIEDDLENIRLEQKEPHSQGYIYLIHMEGTSFCKIGMSLDPQIRLRTLQTGNPHSLHLLRTQAVQDMRSAEASLHRQFETQRVPNLNVREWFDFGNGTGEVETAFDTSR
ncbi:hypothetical protein MMC30_009073 [Trapelia coarctata]|nr:hypothetical protein [Trapelia coarctata]